jgi:small-conductance mechanosensitive channel/CRP-like cAMP-binding protein
MIGGFALLIVALALRTASSNRHVRGRLLASAAAFAAYLVVAALPAYLAVSPELQRQLDATRPLLIAFGIINGFVALAINPWRADRLPDRFPKIVQDTIVIVLFAVAAMLLLQERVFATTAVGAVVIGFALQDTLGNLFAGLAIQIEKPFHVGDWVRLAGLDGLVLEITWRATKIRTRSGNFVIVPNSVLARDTITNYSQPTHETRIDIDIGASYDAPPNQVKAVILTALRSEALVSATPPPEVFVTQFADSSINYRICVWTIDFADEERLHDRVRSAVYYAFRRANIEIPYPHQVEIVRSPDAFAARGQAELDRVFGSVDIFSMLGESERDDLAHSARAHLYGAGEIVVRQGEPGSSMFVVISGEAVVALDSGQEVARIRPGGFFGEMSLLTGAPRTATVRAAVDTKLLEITADSFRQFVLANPAAVEQISLAVAARTAELDQVRSTGVAVATPERSDNLLSRVRRFLRLTANQM